METKKLVVQHDNGERVFGLEWLGVEPHCLTEAEVARLETLANQEQRWGHE